MKNIFFATLSVMVLLSCNRQSNEIVNQGSISDVYNINNLKKDIFTIDNSKDTIINCNQGTKLQILKNIFVDSLGNTISGEITIEVIEALRPIDRVLANLTTIYNGQPLESGGMVYINAQSNTMNLLIAANKSIEVAIPSDSLLSNMSLFEGQIDSSGIKWSNPSALRVGKNNDSIRNVAIEKSNNVSYHIEGFSNMEDWPKEVEDEISRILWAGDGLKISKDSTLKIGKYTVQLVKMDILNKWIQTSGNTLGTNLFFEDNKTNYIFSLKKLGWANIDRLLNDPRTKEVELITSIENYSDFKIIYISLLTKNMYLPGYQKTDKSFGFSHNDDEKSKLPIGEEATIIATAYKNDIPFFAIKKFIITEKDLIRFKLEETTLENLNQELRKRI